VITTCLNLREQLGDVYRIGFDPVYDPFHVPKDKLDPWMMTIPCQRGTIFPHGGDVLAVEVSYALAKRLAALGLKVHQDGDREKTFLFTVERFEEVAAIVKPKRRRRLSPEQAAKLAAAGAFSRFRAGVQSISSERQGVEVVAGQWMTLGASEVRFRASAR
jgi:hypothetical protein